jgi:3-oxoacyl-[acyl-carrier protein] reductase
MDLDMAGKLAVVAGATGALGHAVCEGLVAEGARLVLIGRDELKLRESVRRLTAGGSVGSVGSAVVDLGDQKSFDAAFEQLVKINGIPDMVISAAGSTQRIDVDGITADDFAAAMTSKLIPNVRLILAVGRAMSERGSGRIVVVSGVGGVQPMSVHLPGGSTNAALSLFATGYARHLAEAGVALNIVNPGAVESPRLAGHFEASRAGSSGMSEVDSRTTLMKKIPAGRAASPAEIAHVILFLASDRSSYMLSTSVNVDGGQVVGP